MKEWLAMGGHGFYIWCSYGALAIAVGVELYLLKRGRRRSLERALQHRTEQEWS
jgi:heme exporter protein CcmD